METLRKRCYKKLLDIRNPQTPDELHFRLPAFGKRVDLIFEGTLVTFVNIQYCF